MSQNPNLDYRQFVLSAVIAFVGSLFTWVTYLTENARIEHDRKTAEVRTVRIAIADMSKQLGLMSAQCPSEIPLRTLGTNSYPNKLEVGCFAAYLEARSLLYYTQIALPPDGAIELGQWKNMWNQFEKVLVQSGSRGYVDMDIRTHWKKVIENSAMRDDVRAND